MWFTTCCIAQRMTGYVVYVDLLFWRTMTHCKLVWGSLASILFISPYAVNSLLMHSRHYLHAVAWFLSFFFSILYNILPLTHGQKLHHQFYNITLEPSRQIIVSHLQSSCFQNRAGSLELLFPGSFQITCSLRHLFSLFPYLALDNCSDEWFLPDPQVQTLANIFSNTISTAVVRIQRCIARQISLLHGHRNSCHRFLDLLEVFQTVEH